MAGRIPKVPVVRLPKNPVAAIARKMRKKLAQVLKEDGGSSETKVY